MSVPGLSAGGGPVFGRWVAWVGANAGSDPGARRLGEFLDAQRRCADAVVADHAPCRILDAGCGAGEHLARLVAEHRGCAGLGVDVDEVVIDRARRTRVGGADAPLEFRLEDLRTLPSVVEDSVDVALCMTNTFGNLSRADREVFLASVRRVLCPSGVVMLAVYDLESVADRLESYAAVGLEATAHDDRITTTEGLVSRHFDPRSLAGELERAGFALTGPPERFGGIGLCAVASLPPRV